MVTGGAGFIGSNFVRYVCSLGGSDISKVSVLDDLTYAGNKSNLKSVVTSPLFQFVKGNICDRPLIDRIIHEHDAIINFAAESHVDNSILNATSFVNSNIVGVQVLLDAILASKRKIRFIQISTDEVYGSIEYGSWVEESPLLPNSPYSASKASAEMLVRAFNRTHGIDTVITRCSNNYGPFHYPEKLIPLFITNLLEGKKVPIYGDGTNVRDWLHVEDHCQAIFKVLQNGKSGEVYNIGGGRELTNLEITYLILNAMGKDESSIEFIDDRKGHDFRYSVDWKKINRELRYEPAIDFENGLNDTIMWYTNNIEWWKKIKGNSR